MRAILMAAAVLVAAPAWADPAVQAPIRAMQAAFNAGDVAAAKATHVAAPTILDEVAAPFAWSGPTAFDDWIGVLSTSEAARGRTGGRVALGPASRETVDGDRAYVIVPSTYSFLQKGVRMRETGSMTFALTRIGAGWKIAAWSWSSPAAVVVR